MNMQARRALVPEDVPGFGRDPARAIARAAAASARARLDRSKTAAEHAAAMWSFDSDAQLVLRAAVTPHNMTDTATLVQIALAVLPLLRPYSAAAQLFQAALSVTLGPEAGGFTVPGIGPSNVAFVAEGAAKPAVQGVSTGKRLDPHKIAGITVASSELLAQPSAEDLLRGMLAESVGPVLDAAVFSATAASAAQPAGLLNGIAGLTPDPGTGQKDDAMIADLAALVSAIAPISGGSKIALVMSGGQFMAFAARATASVESVIVLPAAVAEGTVIAIATNAVVSAIGVPAFETNTQTTISMNDTATAWPGGPVQSMFQTANVAIKLELPVTWALRSPQGVAWMTGVNW